MSSDFGSEQFLTARDLADRYSVALSTVWRWPKENPEFPKPIRLGAGCTRWRLSDLVAFEKAREAGQ